MTAKRHEKAVPKRGQTKALRKKKHPPEPPQNGEAHSWHPMGITGGKTKTTPDDHCFLSLRARLWNYIYTNTHTHMPTYIYGENTTTSLCTQDIHVRVSFSPLPSRTPFKPVIRLSLWATVRSSSVHPSLRFPLHPSHSRRPLLGANLRLVTAAAIGKGYTIQSASRKIGNVTCTVRYYYCSAIPSWI